MSFEAWFEELKRIAESEDMAVGHPRYWRWDWEQGLSPHQAHVEALEGPVQ